MRCSGTRWRIVGSPTWFAMTTMGPEIEAIFHAAREAASDADRERILDRACGSDLALRVRVEALLAADGAAAEFLEAADIRPMEEPLSEGPGTMIGNYKLLQLIGEGGMGAVYMAEQQQPVRRKVALKIIKLGMDTRQVVARFEAERQALALMDHPNIAHVLDAGATGTGRPYFVMELVRGIAIDEYCDKNHLSTHERLELFLPVCSAIQHAHQKGIIHRDLKPGNVLVTLHDGRPAPKVIDFGIAKAVNQRLTEKTLFTEFHQFIGTPEYMSPEQAEMSGLDIDSRTDIYALGVLLYKLLTGTTPFDAKTLREAGYMEFQRVVCEEEPQPLSMRVTTADDVEELAHNRRAEPDQLSRLFRGDLDWIVLKALEKDRTRRYDSATSLADDIRRHLSCEPVHAGPPSATYKLGKFVRRHRVLVMAGALGVATLILGTTLALFGLIQARQEADRSQKIADFLQDMLVAAHPGEQGGYDIDVAQVVETARDVFGDDHATVAAAIGSLATQLQSTGNWDAAEPLYRESVRMWSELEGPDGPMVGRALARLGQLLRVKDDPEGEQVLRRSLEILTKLPRDGGVVAANSYLELAEILQNHGKYPEAETAWRESLRIRRNVAPHQLMLIATTLNTLANGIVISGRVAEAEPVVREVLEAFRRAIPEKSDIFVKVLVQIALYYLQLRDLDRAEALAREGLEIQRGLDEPSVIYRDLGLSVLGKVCGARDDGTQAYVATRRAFVDYALELVEADSPFRAELHSEYARYFGLRGFPEDSLRMALDALDISRRRELTQSMRKSLSALRKAGWVIAREPKRERDAYELALKAATMYLAEKPDEFAVVNTKGVLEYRLGRFEAALATLAKSDAHYTESEGGSPADVAFIALAHKRLGHGDEARAALGRLRELMQRKKYASNATARAFLGEAEALFEPGD